MLTEVIFKTAKTETAHKGIMENLFNSEPKEISLHYKFINCERQCKCFILEIKALRPRGDMPY